MPQTEPRAAATGAQSRPGASIPAVRLRQPFFGLIDSVTVEGEKGGFTFDGSVPRACVEAAWTWMTRDVGPDLIDAEAPETDESVPALEAVLPELLARAREDLAAVRGNYEAERRISAQIGGEEAFAGLPLVLNALKCRALLDKAKGFGRATNTIADDAPLALALQSMPLADQAMAALLMHAAVGQVSHPGRLMAVAVRIAGGATETSILRSGFGPLVDAILSHAQNQIPPLAQRGAFADFDLACRSIDRFHRLIRAINGYVELGRLSRWSNAVGGLITTASALLEPRLRAAVPDVSQALRRREGADRLDRDQLLAALNGVYLLATVRDCRDSLALNAVFDQAWAQVGQLLETHLERALDTLRANPADQAALARIDAGAKMAELRFNAEYADVLRRARDNIEKHVALAG